MIGRTRSRSPAYCGAFPCKRKRRTKVRLATFCVFIISEIVASSVRLLPQTLLIGDSSVESVVDSTVAGQAEAFTYLTNSTGTVTSISAYVGSNNKFTKLYVGLYTDNGHPNTLLTQGVLSSPKGSAWNN